MRNFEHAAHYGRVAALALFGFLIFAPAADYVFAQDGGSVATGDGGSTGDASGSDTGSASTGTSGTASAGDGTAGSDISSSGSAEQTSGDTTTEANTTATSTANVDQEGSGYDATSSATAGGDTGGGGAVGSVTATASADTTGVNPTASASTDNGTQPTSANATFGQEPVATAPLGGKEIEKQNAKKSVAIAIAPDGSYSIAVAKKNSAYAKSGTNYYGKTLNAAVRSLVAAYAKATRDYGLANASASAWASSNGGGGFARSSSWTNAFACVGSGCQKKTRVSRRAFKKLLVRCTWHESKHVLTCPPNVSYATTRR
jgi:hypothetical protein